MLDTRTMVIDGTVGRGPCGIWVRHCPICQREIAKRRAWDEWVCPRCGWHGA